MYIILIARSAYDVCKTYYSEEIKSMQRGQTNTLFPVSERRLGGGKIVNYVKFKANMYYIYDAL